jgi:hypothetical protein
MCNLDIVSLLLPSSHNNVGSACAGFMKLNALLFFSLLLCILERRVQQQFQI